MKERWVSRREVRSVDGAPKVGVIKHRHALVGRASSC